MEKEKFYEDLECFKIQHLMTDPGETVNYSVCPEADPRDTLRLEENKINCFPGDQPLSDLFLAGNSLRCQSQSLE